MVDPAPIRDKSADVIKSGTMRGTLAAQTAAIVGALVTTINPLLGSDFKAGQKTAIIIAAIAFIAIAQLADVLARAWTSAAAMRTTMFKKPLAVHVHAAKRADEYNGDALGVDAAGEVLVAPEKQNGAVEARWVPGDDVEALRN